MRVLFIVFMCCYSVLTSAGVDPDKAKSFLKSMNCQFSAFLTTASGRVASVAVCAESFQEQTPGAHKYCAVRGADIEEGVYTSDPHRGDLRRAEGSFCNKEAITKILSTNFYKRELKGQTQFLGGSWTIVDDKHGVSDVFISSTK